MAVDEQCDDPQQPEPDNKNDQQADNFNKEILQLASPCHWFPLTMTQLQKADSLPR